MKTDDDGKYKVVSAYSAERVKEIRAAIVVWYKSLPAPRSKVAAGRLALTYRTVAMWLSGERPNYGPSPGAMDKLFDETGNPVFLLSESEKQIFKVRGFDVGGVAMDGIAEVPAAKVEPIVQKKSAEIAAPNELLFRLARHNLISVGSILHAAALTLDCVREIEVPADLKKFAAELARKIAVVFKLTAEDFAVKPVDEEKDPEQIRRIEKIIGPLTGGGA
jgi:hypothetical protein